MTTGYATLLRQIETDVGPTLASNEGLAQAQAALLDLVVNTADRLAANAILATQGGVLLEAATTKPLASAAASPPPPSSDLVNTINYLLDDVIGLDRSSRLVQVVATQSTNDSGLVKLDFNFALGAWPREILEALPPKIFTIEIDAAKLGRDRSYAVEIEALIKTRIDGAVDDIVDIAIAQTQGFTHTVAATSANALRALLKSSVVGELTELATGSLLALDLPSRDAAATALGNVFDTLSSEFFKTFLPEIAKSYAKLGLSEILTIATSGSDPTWATAITSVGNGVFRPIINNIVDNYFLETGTPRSVLDGVDFSDVFGRAIAGAIVDFKALDKKIIDDILGLDGNGFLDREIGGYLAAGLNNLVEDGFVSAVRFLSGEFDQASILENFSDFGGVFDTAAIQSLLGGFLQRYTGTQLAELVVNIDSLPEALAARLGAFLAGESIGGVITSLATSAVTEIFGQAAATAIGAQVFNGLGAILGVGVGSIAGSVIFELLDGLFDGAISGFFGSVINWFRNESPQAFYGVTFDRARNEFVASYEYSKDSNPEMRAAVKAISDAFETRVDAVIAFVGQKASFDFGYEFVMTAWGKKHFDSKYASYVISEDNKLVWSSDPTTVALATVGGVLRHMNFNSGNPILALAYEMWKAEVAAGGNGSNASYASADAFARLQELIGLAHFANGYRQDQPTYDALIAGDSAIGVTILQQVLEAQAIGFLNPTILRGSDLNVVQIGSADAGDSIFLGVTATRAVARGGNDSVYGSGQNDFISGGAGNDALYGNAGADTVEGDEGADKVYGGDGDDLLRGGSGNDLLLGDLGNDRLEGGSGNDQLYGFAGGDVLLGGDGDDQIGGEDGDDYIEGGNGNDVVYGDGANGGNDVIFAGDGDDIVRGGGGNDQVAGDVGNDRLFGDAGDDQIDGGLGADFAEGGDGADVLYGGLGDDRLMGDAGNDQIYGESGNDRLFAGAGNDRIDGGDGNDIASGDEGDDIISGGLGADTLSGWTGRDYLDGGDGNDLLRGEDGDDRLFGGGGDDTLYGDREATSSAILAAQQSVIDYATAAQAFGNFAILYQGSNYNVAGLTAANHDLLIINPASNASTGVPAGETLWTSANITSIEASGKRLVGYLDLAKINDFTKMWNPAWTTDGTANGALTTSAPRYLGAVDPNFSNTRLANFWEGSWKQVLHARIDTIIGQGFDGLFLDDVLDYFTRRGSDVASIAQAAREMRDLVIDVATYARGVVAARSGADAAAQFQIIVNGAPFIIQDTTADGSAPNDAAAASFYRQITAVLAENYVSGESQYAIDHLRAQYASRGIVLLSADTGQQTGFERISTAETAALNGLLPYVTDSENYSSLGSRFVVGFGETPVPGNDVLDGGAGDDTIFGLSGDDMIDGAGGNDTLNGGGGNDTIIGGTGVDTAIYAATRAQTTVTRNANGALTVTSTADGTDAVSIVELFQFADGLYSFRYSLPGNPVVSNFGVNAGGWSSQDRYSRHVADVNGDGYADIVGFGQAGTVVSYGSANGTFSAAATVVANFGQAQGWASDNSFHRKLIDVNKDGRADIVGFGIGGVLVSLAEANGSFAAPTLGISNFNQANGWSSQDAFTRTLGDVNGDGFADIVGFGIAGTHVALGKGDGTFGNASFALANFGANQGWTSDNSFHRTVGDVNGDGRADIVGFGVAGTLVALGQANGSFAAPTLAQSNFGTQQGWSSQDAFARLVGDVNGDGKADVVGFGIAGTFVSYGLSDGSFTAAAFDIANFGANQGWTSDAILHRQLADLNKDGRADIVGFGYNGVFASTAFAG